MAKFCIHCGTPLQEGIPCACQIMQETIPPQPAASQPVQPAQPQQVVTEQPVYTQPVYTQQTAQGQPYTGQPYGQAISPQQGYQQPVYSQQVAPEHGYQQQAYAGQPYGQSYQEQAYTGQTASAQGYQQQPYGGQTASQQAYQQQTYHQQSYTAPNYAQYQQQFDTFKKDSGVYLKKLYVQFMKLIKAPLTEGKTYLKEGNLTLSMGLLTIQALLSGLFVMLALKLCNDLITLQVKGYEEYADGYLFSLPKAFLLTVLLSLILSAVRAGVLFLAGKIEKSTASYETMLHLTAIGAVVASPILAVSIGLSFLNIAYAVAVFVLASTASSLAIILHYTNATKVTTNLVIWILFGAFLAYSVISSLILKNTVALYLPTELKHAYQQSADYLEMIKKYSSFL